MAYLLDTNILLRIAQAGHPSHPAAANAVRTLLRRNERLHLVPQVVAEFWVVATRPIENNGLGLTIQEAKQKIARSESFFAMSLDSPAMYAEWLRLVEKYAVAGVKAHDARLVAAMKVHGLEHILTFNEEDFRRYHEIEIRVVTPEEIL